MKLSDENYSSTENNPVDNINGLERDKRYWTFFNVGIRLALVAHTFYIGLFYYIGSYSLVILNTASVAVYLTCLQLMRTKKYHLLIFLCWLKIIAYTVIAVRIVGWDSGFHYYMFVLIPLIFTNPTRSAEKKIALLILVCTTYILLDAYMHEVTPLTELSNRTLSMARVINTTLAVGFLGYVAFLYVNTVNHSYARLVRFANSDPLTRLFNRRHMVELIEYEQRKFERTKKNFSLIMADVDDFKRVNDLFGHDAGDSVLIELSKRIKQELREHDSIARWGGEEFLVLLPETDIKNAEQIAERIKHVVTSNEFN